jgi:hypothetical protein
MPLDTRQPSACLGALALCAVVCACSAQAPRSDAPISTDRPGFLFAPTVVPAGRVQLEAGLPTWSSTRNSGSEFEVASLPVALRFGLTDRLELRATLPVWTETDAESGGSSPSDAGWGDSEVGAKLALPPLAGGPLAALAALRVPTGDTGFTTDEVGGSAFLLHGRDVGRGFWLQSMLGLTHTPVGGAADATSGALAALLAHPIAGRWSAFVEVTALPGLAHAPGQGYVGAALVWTPSERMQIDLSADFGVDDDASDVIAALGVSVAH